MIVGGWDYIWSAYGIVWVTLICYSASLVWRSRKGAAS